MRFKLAYVPLITIDGVAGVGKGTLRKRLAESFGLKEADSGMLYRAVASISLTAPNRRLDIIAEDLTNEDLHRSDLRSDEVTELSCRISQLKSVRSGVNAYMRRQISRPPGWVIDGRAGAYEYPEAHVKIYLHATDEVCATRRMLQIKKSGGEAEYETVLQGIRARNRKDAEREIFPMQPAPDAYIIDTDNLNQEEVYQQAFQAMQKGLKKDADYLYAIAKLPAKFR